MDPATQAREIYTQAQLARSEGRLDDAHRQLGKALTLLSGELSFDARMLQADIYLSDGEMYMAEAASATSADPLTAGEPYGKASQQLLRARDIARAIIDDAGLVGADGFTRLDNDTEWPEVWARHGMALSRMARLATLHAVRNSLAAAVPGSDETFASLARDFAHDAMLLYAEAGRDLSRGRRRSEAAVNAAATTRNAFLLTQVSNREAEQESAGTVLSLLGRSALTIGLATLYDPSSLPYALTTTIEFAAALQDKQTVQESILAEP